MLELVARHLRSSDRPKMEVLEASDGDEAWRIARDRLLPDPRGSRCDDAGDERVGSLP